MIISFIGSKGSGKTSIADALRDRINGLHISIHDISNEETKDAVATLGNIARMMAYKQDKPVIVDFSGKTKEIRDAFGNSDISIWVDTVPVEDGWENPDSYSFKISVVGDQHADALPTRAFSIITEFNLFDWKPEGTLMIGRYQPWHKGHVFMYNEAKRVNGNVIIGVRHVQGMTDVDPYSFEEVKASILRDIPDARIIKVPNISNISYGRDPENRIKQIEMPGQIKLIFEEQKHIWKEKNK